MDISSKSPKIGPPLPLKASRRLRRSRFPGDIIRELINFIRREGSDPNIIRKIEDMDD